MRVSHLVISTALLTAGLSTTVWAHESATGQDYRRFTQPNGLSCCSNRDCRPATYRHTSDGLVMFPDGRRVRVPRDKVIPTPSDDGNTHRCRVFLPGGDAATSAPSCHPKNVTVPPEWLAAGSAALDL
jgi:hypothetical protein